MRYKGGKARTGAHIAKAILESTNRRESLYVPFCGMCGVAYRLNEHFDNVHASDANKYVIALLDAVTRGWKPPRDVSEDLYREVKSNPGDYHDRLAAFIGFGCSFGGKWFGGYARTTGRNFANESVNSLMRLSQRMRGAEFSVLGYQDVKIQPNSVVYCDIPYDKTSGYPFNFDIGEFWNWAIDTAAHSDVFVSEYSIPDGIDHEVVWQQTRRQSLGLKPKNTVITESLYKVAAV